MIDWLNVFTNSLWILALAIMLATLSISRWEALQNERKVSDYLHTPSRQLIINMTGILFSLSLLLTSKNTWERVAWVVLMLLFIAQSIFARKNNQC